MTYSIGFRAPTAANALESFALESERLGRQDERYCDPDLVLDRHHAEITTAEIDKLRGLAVALLDESSVVWRDAVGKMLSDSAVTTPDEDDAQPIYLSDLQACAWIRHPETRLFYHRGKETLAVYYNGRVHALPNHPGNLEQLQKLCENREWPATLVRETIRIEAFQTLLLELASNHAILPLTD
jgi:ribosomal protein L16 Arg81 hydroxylase